MTLTSDSWTSDNAKVWREFLDTTTGQRLLRLIAQEEPELLSKGDVNEILIRSGELRHHKSLVSLFLFLVGEIVEEQPTVSLAYPPLDDDKYWEGDKLNK
jgi:hypothetical protein